MSQAKIANALPEQAFQLLHTGTPAVLVTVGSDGWGHAVMTWVVALSPHRMRFGVDLGTSTLANLQRDGKATLQVIARNNVLVLLKGRARQVRERIAAAPFGMAMWEMDLTAVKDQTWGGVVVALEFEWAGPRAEESRRIEQAVLQELREWQGSPAR